VGTFLYHVIVSPLELLVEFVYVFFLKSFENSGIAIACISIVVSMLTLPLYYIADSLQRIERDTRKKLQPGVDRIKAVYKGDERYMILSTFYRQNHYHPAYALRSSVSLMIQVPFFMAAYRFLSHLQQLNGQSFLFLADLGKPDQLLTIGGIAFNVMPIAMTVINIVSGMIYTKGFPLRDKLQLYGMAGLFMVLLYQSPSGLVYYWTLNNIFSLLKNVFYKMKRPLKVLYFCASIGSIALAAAINIEHPSLSVSNMTVLYGTCLSICLVPLLLRLIQAGYESTLRDFSTMEKQRNVLFVLSCLVLWFLYGLAIPSNVISSSTIEFSFLGDIENPLLYVCSTATLFFGIWCLWPLGIYGLANKKGKAMIAYLFVCLALIGVLNVYVFKGSYGTVSTHLEFENPTLLVPSPGLVLVSILAGVLVFVSVGYLLGRGKGQVLSSICMILAIATLAAALFNCRSISSEFREHRQHVLENQAKEVSVSAMQPIFHLSKEGKNVVVLFLDRAIGSYFPLVLEQVPELKDQLRGFAYYPNTVSYGTDTLYGSPPMMGGYEYTPEQMNQRDTEKLVTKHNEATLVVPRLFDDAGYSVTITDPPFCNYKWEGDFTPFNSYPEMDVIDLIGKYSIQYKKEHADVLDWDDTAESVIIQDRFPVFSLMKAAAPIFRKTIYDNGDYFLVPEGASQNQALDIFIDSYSTLYYLPEITDYSASGNTYTFIDNDTTHSPALLQVPEFEPRSNVTNCSTPFDDVPGITEIDRATFLADVAALKRVGIWFDRLREDGMYDNTRIIIVADHGRNVYTPLFADFEKNNQAYSRYNPLFLVKDFGADGELQTDRAFMTNADAPLMEIRDLEGVSSVNPFTGNDLYECVQKQKVNLYTGSWDPKKNLGTQFRFDYSGSFSVHDDISVEANWSPIQER
jgi:YidC/Oxa1 family membrane protein insertase